MPSSQVVHDVRVTSGSAGQIFQIEQVDLLPMIERVVMRFQQRVDVCGDVARWHRVDLIEQLLEIVVSHAGSFSARQSGLHELQCGL